jgi:glycosyltransferase involved in cell wall biosynthesis
MNITFVSTGLGIGGAELALLRLCKALRRGGARPAVVSLLDEGPLASQFQDCGTPLLSLHLRGPGAWTSMRRSLDSFHETRRPHVIQGWMYHGSLAALLLARRGTPVSWGIRQSLLGNKDKLGTRVAIRASAALSGRADAIVYNSSAARQQHEAIGFSGDRASVIPNGFDLGEFPVDSKTREVARTSLGISPDQVVVGHVARFHVSKDHATFLKAISNVVRSRPSVHAVLAGEGVDHQNRALAALVSQLGISTRISLLGRRSDVPALMRVFDVFCSSSAGMEGFPNVVAEAMCCEVPCVVTDVGDARVLADRHGEVVSPGDIDALSSALGRVVDMSPEARRHRGQAARRHIADWYGVESVAVKYVRLYESLVRAREDFACAG